MPRGVQSFSPPSPEASVHMTSEPNNLQSSIFFGPHGTHDLTDLYPFSKNDCYLLLEMFFTNVDPMIRITHQPTLREQFAAFVNSYAGYQCTPPLSKSSSMDILEGDGSFEPLFFAICYSAINSLTPDSVLAGFQVEKDELLGRFRQGVELSLAKADFVSSPEPQVLRAFVIVLACARGMSRRFGGWLTSLADNNVSRGRHA